MNSNQRTKSQLTAEARAIEGAAVGRELTAGEVARLQTIYQRLNAIEADAEAGDGWIGK
jgi:hypothetical protein